MTRRRRRPPSLQFHETPGPVLLTLDLHGDTADEARRRTELWLRARQGEGVLRVRVVTGRGLHSLGPPVLLGEVDDLLRTLAGTVVADWWSEASGGAFVVELRRPARNRAERRRAGAPPGRVGDGDPELRARAEQNLWELGIAATPVLIAAEMRRLADGGE